MPSPLAQLRAVSPAPAHPPSASVARVVTWTEFPAKNCWWGGHGAEEVDTPRGSAVSGVKTIDACKAACLDKTQCDGVLFQKSSGKCFRKARLQPGLCRPDDTLTLFVLQDPNRPPAPPFAPSLGSFASPAKCSAALRDPNHKFYKMWSADNGFTGRARGAKACWDVPWADSWFDFVGDATNCDQDWDWTGNNMPDAPTVFGFSETMAAYCLGMAGRRGGGGDPGHACRNAHINILRIGSWTMCRCAAAVELDRTRPLLLFASPVAVCDCMRLWQRRPAPWRPMPRSHTTCDALSAALTRWRLRRPGIRSG